jgi:hypothetical protein
MFVQFYVISIGGRKVVNIEHGITTCLSGKFLRLGKGLFDRCAFRIRVRYQTNVMVMV